MEDVETGDQCWNSFFTMKDKRSYMVWLAEDEPRPEVLKTGFRSRKRSVHHVLQFSRTCFCQYNARQIYNYSRILYLLSFGKRSRAYPVDSTDSKTVSQCIASQSTSHPWARLMQNGIHLMKLPPYLRGLRVLAPSKNTICDW